MGSDNQRLPGIWEKGGESKHLAVRVHVHEHALILEQGGHGHPVLALQSLAVQVLQADMVAQDVLCSGLCVCVSV